MNNSNLYQLECHHRSLNDLHSIISLKFTPDPPGRLSNLSEVPHLFLYFTIYFYSETPSGLTALLNCEDSNILVYKPNSSMFIGLNCCLLTVA